jgi:hypothetical protein
MKSIFLLAVFLFYSCDNKDVRLPLELSGCKSISMTNYFKSTAELYDTLSVSKSYLNVNKKPYKFIKIKKIEKEAAPLVSYYKERYFKEHRVSNLDGATGKFFQWASHLHPNIDNLLMVDSTKELITFLYIDPKYDAGLGGYWIAFSKDNGIIWEKHYTGLSMNYPYHIKPNSKLRMWKNRTTLQFEVAIVKNVGVKTNHWISPNFITVKDSLLVEFKLSDIARDSDGDGLSDILEKKFLLNPSEKDTDMDGIDDFSDTNPRNKLQKSELYSFYKYILNSFIYKERFLSKSDSSVKYESDNKISVDMKIILSDNEDVLGIHPTSGKITVLTNKEYRLYMQKYPSSASIRRISPLFKCDTLKNVYKILISNNTSSQSVYLEKSKGDWIIKPGIMAVQ